MKNFLLLFLGLGLANFVNAQVVEHENPSTKSHQEVTLTLYLKGSDFNQSVQEVEELVSSFQGKKLVKTVHNPGSQIVKIIVWKGFENDLEEILVEKNLNAYWIVVKNGIYYMVNIHTKQEVEMKQGEFDKISADL